MRPQFDHVSIAVPDLGPASGVFRLHDLTVGELQEFEGENTAETYVETAPVRLLLQQPRSGEGPLARHLTRRGAGFHHIAFGVADVEQFSAGLAGSGWLMTPTSLLLRRRAGTIWLVKPEMGLLVEVFERREPTVTPAGNSFRQIALVAPHAGEARRLFRGLGFEVPEQATPEPAMGCDTLDVTGAGAAISIKIPTPGDGPLRRFLVEHGPGIHHIALATPAGPRWYVHSRETGGALVEIGL
jgi:methylmalonyl-CoA/ethylmalonyl-CoA epimerase